MDKANKSGVPSIAKAKNEGERAAKKAAFSPLMDRLTRLGYGIKGLIYMTIGILSLGAVLGKNSSPADQVGAITEIGKLPLGGLVLWIVLIGLISYSLWGIIRAVLDPYHKGTDTPGLLERGGYLVSAVTYASFVLPTYQLIKHGSSGSSSNQTGQIISKIMAMPFGREIVGALGVVIILGGAYQIYAGAHKNFNQRFKPYALSVEQRKAATQLGRFGTIARGLVFALTGVFVLLAAWLHRPGTARGLDGALRWLGQQPYGLWVLGIIALGLIAFGVYSLMGAAWFRFKDTQSR
jgi:hypothetical protein